MVTVIHLVWAPLGAEPVQRFAAALRRHPAGSEHRLLVVLNGFDDAEAAREARAALEGLAFDELLLEAPVIDLEAYRLAALRAETDAVCILNSYARPLADGWLGHLVGALGTKGVGLAGASGSYESTYSAAPPWLRPLRREFPRFPNPHLRTNAFVVERERLLAAYREPISDKRAALRLENGRHSLSRQVWDADEEVVVVGRDGRARVHAEWPRSRTFRSGDQDNLLVADNRTDQYAHADARQRLRLARLAWGDAAEV